MLMEESFTIDYWHKMAAVEKEDFENSFIDEYGVTYSNDGKRLLKGCDLYKYRVREGTEVICNDAFDNCYPVELVIFPKSLKYIGDRAFQSTFPDGITFPTELKGIGECAFHFTRGRAKELVIPDSVIFVGKAAFHRMAHLKKVVIGNGLTTISELLFAGCNELEELAIPSTVTIIDNSAFEYCSINRMTIPDSVIKIGANPFYGIKELECLSEHFILEDNVLYSKDRKELVICNTVKKDFYVPKGVEVIRPLAFNDSKAESVVLPETMNEIGKEAFCRSKLKSIRLPASIKTIGQDAFSFSDLESIYLPDGITQIEKQAFMWCEKLKEIHFPENLETIGERGFYLCRELANVELPEKLREIGNAAFSQCHRMKEISLPKSIETIGSNPFALISDLKISCQSPSFSLEDGILYSADGKRVICFVGKEHDIRICEGVEVIGTYAFNSTNITSISLPSTIQVIEKGAFGNCEKLRNINLPDSVLYIGEDSFERCKNLSVVTLPSQLKEISASTFFGSGIKEILLPDYLETIGNKAFSCCRHLKKIKIPSQTKAIGKEAFNACESLESIILPSNVETIGAAAFRLCRSLKEIKLPSILKLQDALFEYSDSLTDIYIPDSVQHIGKKVFSDVKPNYSLLSNRIAQMVEEAKRKDLDF